MPRRFALAALLLALLLCASCQVLTSGGVDVAVGGHTMAPR